MMMMISAELIYTLAPPWSLTVRLLKPLLFFLTKSVRQVKKYIFMFLAVSVTSPGLIYSPAGQHNPRLQLISSEHSAEKEEK